MNKTIFEKIIEKTIPAHIIYEDSDTIAILDITPKNLGHTLVIPKKVSKNLLEMPTESLGQYFTIVQKVAQAVKKAFEAEGCIFLLDGREVLHTHTHVIPRFKNDPLNFDFTTHKTYSSQNEAKEYAEKIKAHLS